MQMLSTESKLHVDVREREAGMKLVISLFLLAFAGFPATLAAQQSSAKLSDSQREGRRIFQQKCAMCHVPATATAKTLGPGLSKALVNADEAAVRTAIMDGMGNTMPGFKYMLTPAQVGNVLDFLKTLDSPPHTLSSERPER
jgi:mono/diheme cytochrome c family protein